MLDAVIRYGDDYGIVLESKLSETSEGLLQASNITFNSQTIQFEGSVIVTTWRGVLAYYTNLADQERLLISEPREIINDFLDFIERNLRELGPFNTLVSCGEEPPRIRYRLEAIMSGPWYRRQNASCVHTNVKLAILEYENEKQLIKIRLSPADTLE